jgi:hypothetical protein
MRNTAGCADFATAVPAMAAQVLRKRFAARAASAAGRLVFHRGCLYAAAAATAGAHLGSNGTAANFWSGSRGANAAWYAAR